uniref:Uncharacterized protein n=1 Tax=Arundo donax TaxID=35708 RepID=A0A0A9DWL9_ARUDO
MHPVLAVVRQPTLNIGFRASTNLLNPSYSVKVKGIPCKEIIRKSSRRAACGS